MPNTTKPPTSLAGVFEGHAPKGYTELTVADKSGLPLLRVFARDDVVRRYALDKLTDDVLEAESPTACITVPRLRLA